MLTEMECSIAGMTTLDRECFCLLYMIFIVYIHFFPDIWLNNWCLFIIVNFNWKMFSMNRHPCVMGFIHGYQIFMFAACFNFICTQSYPECEKNFPKGFDIRTSHIVIQHSTNRVKGDLH